MYGKVEYDKIRDVLQCEICKNWFDHLGLHVLRYHKIQVRDYKREHGLDMSTPLCSQRISLARHKTSLKTGFNTKYRCGGGKTYFQKGNKVGLGVKYSEERKRTMAIAYKLRSIAHRKKVAERKKQQLKAIKLLNKENGNKSI